MDAEGEHPYSVWPRSAGDRAMPRSFVGNMVNKNFAIEPLPRVVYVHSQSSYKSTSACIRPSGMFIRVLEFLAGYIVLAVGS